MLDPTHGLVVLAGKIDWAGLDAKFVGCYRPNIGAPAKAIRLIVGLQYLKSTPAKPVLRVSAEPTRNGLVLWIRSAENPLNLRVVFQVHIRVTIGVKKVCACARRRIRTAPRQAKHEA